MFDFTGWEKINEDAYVLRGFIPEDMCDEAFEESLRGSNSPNKYVNPENKGIELIGGGMLPSLVEKIESLFEGTQYEIGNFLHWYSEPGKPFGLHRDDQAHDPHPKKKTFGGVIYLAEMDGGELYYPVSNTWMQPHKGDVVVQSSACLHGANSVTGNNKRTVTFVAYDTLQDSVEMSQEWHTEHRNKTIRESKEWLESPIGKRWQKEWSWWSVLEEEDK